MGQCKYGGLSGSSKSDTNPGSATVCCAVRKTAKDSIQL